MKTKKGDRIFHTKYGAGLVLGIRFGGYRTLIQFDNGLSCSVNTDEIEVSEIHNETSDPISTVANSHSYKTAIESLRLGIVPNLSINEWTFGRDHEISQISTWLQDESSGSLVIEGAYGSGKSHLLNYIYHYALKNNFIVSLSSINPLSSPISFPKKIYRNIMDNLAYKTPWGYGNVYDLIFTIINSGSYKQLEDHKILGTVFSLFHETKHIDLLLDYLTGKDIKRRNLQKENIDLPMLPDHTTAANVYCYLLSGISWLAVKLLGYNGFLILLDEMEMAKTYRYYYEWERGTNFLEGLSLVASDEDGVTDERIIKKGNVKRGTITNLIYSGFTPLPYAYIEPSFLKIIVGITPSFLPYFAGFKYDKHIKIDNLDETVIEKVFFKVLQSYDELYGVRLNYDEKLWLQNFMSHQTFDSTRRKIKTVIEALDFKRYYPTRSLTELGEYA